MTKRCTDCKHTKGIGYDFWCGEGHTKYEVFGGETNCPYYEYHDWSKGTPSKTEKRFTIVVTGSDGSFHYWDKFTDERITSTLELENKLNELSDENEQLKKENIKLKEDLEHCANQFTNDGKNVLLGLK